MVDRSKKYYIRAMNNLRLEWLLFSSISAEFNSKKYIGDIQVYAECLEPRKKYLY